jgi:hypothetical protein
MFKPNQVRIRLYADDEAVVKRISEHTRLSLTDVVSMILHASLRSIEENGGKFPMPLRFDIAEDASPVRGNGHGATRSRVKRKKLVDGNKR